ncbi:lysoplasmalogenase family protein [Pseudorhodobacter ferrugineus]|nr:lysoplasmalogenase family protein [Pseudorhodobacter ferrugineus]
MLLLCSVGCFLTYWMRWAALDQINVIGAWVKTAATGLIALVVLRGAAWHQAVPLMGLMGLGLAFGAAGDFALALRNDRAFLAGMAAFAIGHLIYAWALWAQTQSIMGMSLDAGGAFGGAGLSPMQIGALVGLALVMLSTEAWLAPKTGALRWPVRGYVVVIGIMAAVAILLVENAGGGVLRLGAALFVLSDLLLALRLFVVTTSPCQADIIAGCMAGLLAGASPVNAWRNWLWGVSQGLTPFHGRAN